MNKITGCRYCNNEGRDIDTGVYCCAEEMEMIRADIEEEAALARLEDELLDYEAGLAA